MEPLALLCTLHGDGPRTLRRLQREGYESLPALLETGPSELADSLGWSEAFAERFLREGGVLVGRLDEGLLEDLDEASPVERGEPERPEERHTDEPAPQAAGVDEVLGTWRELDLENPPATLEATTLIPQRSTPDPAPGPARPGGLGALDADLQARLVGAGVEGAEALLGMPTLELARRLSMGFTRAARIQFLVRRAVRAGSLESSGPFA